MGRIFSNHVYNYFGLTEFISPCQRPSTVQFSLSETGLSPEAPTHGEENTESTFWGEGMEGEKGEFCIAPGPISVLTLSITDGPRKGQEIGNGVKREK